MSRWALLCNYSHPEEKKMYIYDKHQIKLELEINVSRKFSLISPILMLLLPWCYKMIRWYDERCSEEQPPLKSASRHTNFHSCRSPWSRKVNQLQPVLVRALEGYYRKLGIICGPFYRTDWVWRWQQLRPAGRRPPCCLNLSVLHPFYLL